MLFNSAPFYIFLTIVFSLYLLLPHRPRNRMLFMASYIFYGWWDWRFCSLLMMSTGINYYCGIQIFNHLDTDRKAKNWKLIAVIFNLTLLGFFKYYNFFTAELTNAFSQMGVQWNCDSLKIVSPVGISFYTFQTLSYSWDIYRKELKPTRNIWDFGLFVSFFPQLNPHAFQEMDDFTDHLFEKYGVELIQSPKALPDDNFQDPSSRRHPSHLSRSGAVHYTELLVDKIIHNQ